MNEFEQRYELLVKSFIDAAQQNFFGKVREMENAFFEKAVSSTQTELEEFAAGKLDDISEDAQVCLLPPSHLLVLLRCMHLYTLVRWTRESFSSFRSRFCQQENSRSSYPRFRLSILLCAVLRAAVLFVCRCFLGTRMW
jgi:hypothetical protein